MNISIRYVAGLLGAMMALALPAANAVAPGDRVPEAEIAKWGRLPTYDLGSGSIRVIPPQHATGPDTLVINAEGVVGTTRNEVVISGIAGDPMAALRHTQPAPVSVQHYGATGITVLQYADFQQAVSGLAAVKAALPEASVRLPVQFGTLLPK